MSRTSWGKRMPLSLQPMWLWLGLYTRISGLFLYPDVGGSCLPCSHVLASKESSRLSADRTTRWCERFLRLQSMQSPLIWIGVLGAKSLRELLIYVCTGDCCKENVLDVIEQTWLLKLSPSGEWQHYVRGFAGGRVDPYLVCLTSFESILLNM